MTEDKQRQLLDRILTSRQFAHAESLKRILTYICANSKEGDTSSIREYDLAVNAIGRPRSFDPKTDPIVRVSIAGIRERLRSYFETQGAHEVLRLEIPKGQYRAVYREITEPQSKSEVTTGVMKFWRPYLTAGASNVLVYTEVLFFRDDRYNYVRNIFVNDVASGRQDIQQKMPEVDFGDFRPSYHFASAGEMHCVLFLSKQFHDIGARLDMRNSRFSSWNELRESNLIFIGSTRTNKFIDSLQGDQPFLLTSDSIRNRAPNGDEPEEYRSCRYLDGKLERVTEYAIVTRQPGLSPERSVTIISANHGRANEAAGFYLTREDALQRMLQHLGLQAGDSLPARFQVLLKVELIDFDEDVVNVEYVTHRIY